MDAMDTETGITEDQQQGLTQESQSELLTAQESPLPGVAHDLESTTSAPSEDVEHSMPTTAMPDQSISTDAASPSSSAQGDSTSSRQRSQSRTPAKPSTPVPAQPLKRRPRRTGQPLHLLLQDCSKQHISGYLCKKTPEEIKAIVSDKKMLAVDLRNYSNEFVLTSARDRVIGEVDDEGKELLKDVDPERDIIKQRFEDESSVFKSYDDAIHDVRMDMYFEGIKPRKLEVEQDSTDITARNQELMTVIDIWDIYHKRAEVEPKRGGRPTQSSYPSRSGRTAGPPGARPHPYAPYRSPSAGPASGPVPAHHAAPYGGPPALNGVTFRDSKSHHRGYERPPYRDEYYADRRDDYRRPDYDRRDARDYPDPRDYPDYPRDHSFGMRLPPPGAASSRLDPRDMRDMRDPRDFRDRPPPPAARGEVPYGAGGSGRFEDRRRDRPDISNAPPPRGHSGPNGASSSPLIAHPSLPPKPHGSHFDSASNAQHSVSYSQHYPSATHHQQQQQPHMDPQAYYAAYGQSQEYGIPGQTDYSAYGYVGPHAYAYSAAAGWDMTAGSSGTASTGLHLLPFNSNQPGRHKAVPLPTDFMSGPSEAPRLSMPEPHEVLGRISGVIIRDAQGNIGLCQYQFTQST
ncbi:hypothetical protein EDD11_006085 [Mortierella claussenii]|nr:hypothetical protein EDD11_006085 [Mortierella claussenii]